MMIIGRKYSLGYKMHKVCSRPAGMVTVMVDNDNNGIRIDCILSESNKNQLTFTPVYSYGKGKGFTCKPTNDSQSEVIEDKDNMTSMNIVYKKYVQ
ncbi:hypothetical protein HHG37_16375 [Vibrio aestuarianus subsp. francensis]|nr:hypothetical protein [Vibrio aestuarianus]NLS59572.1 hypothetical protein [Vibrio aestuarianus subsp. francensis]